MRPWPLAPLLSLAACSWNQLELRVPEGASGVVPEQAGYPCSTDDRAVALTPLASGTGYQAREAGAATLRCSERDVRVRVVPVASLSIEGPTALPPGDDSASLSLVALDPSGERIDLDSLDQKLIVWKAPSPAQIRLPRCGDVAPLCVGLAGNGTRVRLESRAPGPVTVEVSVMGVSAAHTVTFVAR